MDCHYKLIGTNNFFVFCIHVKSLLGVVKQNGVKKIQTLEPENWQYMYMHQSSSITRVFGFFFRIPNKLDAIQGGPERMQHVRSVMSRKRGTE